MTASTLKARTRRDIAWTAATRTRFRTLALGRLGVLR